MWINFKLVGAWWSHRGQRALLQLFAVVVSKRWLHSTRCARKNRKYQQCGRVNVDEYLSQEATECRKCALGRPSSPREAKYRTRHRAHRRLFQV